MSHVCYAPDDCTPHEYDVEEPCPYCDEYIAISVDRNAKSLETVCPTCGKPLMICSMCERRCDWTENHGCCMDNAHSEVIS